MPAYLRLDMTLTLNYMVIVACTLCCMSESESEQLLLTMLPRELHRSRSSVLYGLCTGNQRYKVVEI